MRRRQDVVGAEHEDPGLGLGLGRQRQVHRHLVAVEVGVERRADERVDLDRLALDEDGLERLDAEAVEGGGPVQEHRVLLDDLLEHVPHLGTGALHHPLGGLDVLGVLEVDEALHHERLEELERHLLGQAALVQAQLRTHDDDRPAAVVDALAEQVLAEPALLALQHVGQRLQRPVARAGDRTAAPAVVEERVDGLLQHPLLVVHDDLGGPEVEQALQAVVAVDDPAVQVVEVGRGEAATVELHHRAQVRRDDRDALEDHRRRRVHQAPVVAPAVERRDHLQALDGLELALALARGDGLPQEDLLARQVHADDEVLDGLGAHAAGEVLAVAVGQLAPHAVVVDEQLGLQPAQRVVDELQLRDLGVARARGRRRCRARTRAGSCSARRPWRPSPRGSTARPRAPGSASRCRGRARARPRRSRPGWPPRARAGRGCASRRRPT